MKNKVSFFVCALAVLTAISCGDQSSGSSSSDFKIQPGDVTKFDTTISGASFNVDFDGSKSGTYAIIFQKNINGTDYVGIACAKNPKSNRQFKLYIYFPSSSLTGTFNNLNASISVIGDNGIKYLKKNAADTISLDISESSGLYEIKSSDVIVLTDGTTDITLEFSGNPDIKAYLIQ